MADISTAVSRARVPILGENGRISNDYIPESIPQSVEAAEQAARDAAGSASKADGSAKAAEDSASAASGSEQAAKGSADAAGRSADAAAGSATQASESAQQAATSATEAASSATKAAQSAEQVADKYITGATATTLEPGEQATAQVVEQVLQLGIPQGEKGDKGDTGTGVPEGGEPGQLLSKTDSGTAWVDPPSTGNVLVGTATGPVAHADDAYATTPRRLTVYGATRQNLWANPSGTEKGVTCTANANGSVTLSGTATAKVATSSPSYVLKPGAQYTASVDKAIHNGDSNTCFYIEFYDNDGGYIANQSLRFGYGPTLSYAITVPSNAGRANMGVMVASGTTVSGTYRIMLNEGSTAQPWCPPGLSSVDELSVVAAEKNLLAASQAVSDVDGWNSTVVSDAGDGWLKAVTPYGVTGIQFNETRQFLYPGKYILSFDAYASKSVALNYNYWMQTNELPNIPLGVEFSAISPTLSTSQKRYNMQLTVPTTMIPYGSLMLGLYEDSAGTEIFIRNVQLELGSTATAYEPPNVTTTPIDLDGHTLNSLPDGTCDELKIDATGAVTLVKRVCAVECEASDFDDSNMDYTEAALTKRCAGGVDFSANRQLSDFASIGNADTTPGHPLVGAYTQGTHTALRGGIGNVEASASAQTMAFKAMLGSQTWHHLYKLEAPETIELPPVTLPTLPAPTVNVFADAESSGTGYAVGADVELEYERDVNIAFEKLEAKISALNVLEATND